jgi:hypothetical protein
MKNRIVTVMISVEEQAPLSPPFPRHGVATGQTCVS